MKQEELVSFGNPNYQGPFGNTLLHSAVITGNIQEVARLLSAGADPTIANRDGRTPVDVAAIMGHQNISDLLMMRVAQPDAQNRISGAPTEDSSPKPMT